MIRSCATTARAFGAHHRLPIDFDDRTHVAHVPSHGWNSYLIGLSATLSRLRPRARARHERAAVVAFVHTAFWNVSAAAGGVGQERYIGPILDAVAARVPAGDLVCVGVGPRRNFRTRRWWDPVAAPGTGRPLVTPIEQLAPRTALKDAHRALEPPRRTGRGDRRRLGDSRGRRRPRLRPVGRAATGTRTGGAPAMAVVGTRHG